MATMTESFPSDALFGVDGTQMPELLPDPLAGPGRGPGQPAAPLPPFVLPPLPDASTFREAIAEALGDDPVQPADQGTATAPVSQAAEPSNTPNADAEAAPPAAAPSAAPPAAAAEEAPAPGAPSGAAPPTEAGNRPAAHHAVVAAPSHPAASSLRRLPRQRNRSSTPAEPREPMAPADLLRRIRRERIGVPLPASSDGGATAALIALLIFMVILIYYIVTGFLNTISSFFS